MKRENEQRVDKVMRRIHVLEKDIAELEDARKNGGTITLDPVNGLTVNLFNKKRNFNKIMELINYSLRDKRKEIIELEEELETL